MLSVVLLQGKKKKGALLHEARVKGIVHGRFYPKESHLAQLWSESYCLLSTAQARCQGIQVSSLALPLTSCMALGKLSKLESLFATPHPPPKKNKMRIIIGIRRQFINVLINGRNAGDRDVLIHPGSQTIQSYQHYCRVSPPLWDPKNKTEGSSGVRRVSSVSI